MARPAPKKEVIRIIVGSFEPRAARTAIAVAGIRVSPAVLIARKVIIEFVAVPLCGFKLSRCSMAFRPSGVADIMKRYGPDSFIGILVSTMYGSSETTFYVLAVYFGAVNVYRTRHAVAAGLIADAVGMLGALLICRLLFG